MKEREMIADFMDGEYPSSSDLSWDWLMPVVSRASHLFYVKLGGLGDVWISEEDDPEICESMSYDNLGWALMMGHIDEVYDIIIEFISWYHKQLEDGEII